MSHTHSARCPAAFLTLAMVGALVLATPVAAERGIDPVNPKVNIEYRAPSSSKRSAEPKLHRRTRLWKAFMSC